MSETCLLKTKLGNIKGICKGDALIFRGIPYCVSKRFESPVLINKWEHDLDATQQETDCPQTNAYLDESETRPFYYREFRKGLNFKYAESPMVLNIVAEKNKQKQPVIIFIHGGAFESGQLSQWPFRDSTEYAKRHIVLVNVSYRLNVFGYYRGNNLGLQDQYCAIEWVLKNIDDYGGDPEKVYLMGQSAGAMSIVDLLSSKKLEGRIKGAILLSGAGWMPKAMMVQNREELTAYWDEFDRIIGKDNLKNVDEKTLWEAWYSLKKDMKMFSPCVDGDFIPDIAKEIQNKNLDFGVPMIVGITSQDIGGPVFYALAKQYADDQYRRHKKNIYIEFFDRKLPGSGNCRSFHSSDLWYFFGNQENSWRPFEQKDELLKNRIIDYVADFVYHNGTITKGWDCYTPKQKAIRYFGDQNIDYISSTKLVVEMLKNMLKKMS